MLRRESSERSASNKRSNANPARNPHPTNTQTRIQRSDSRLKKEDVFRGAGFPLAGSRNRQKISDVAGMAGFEPTISESKSGVLPLHYIPISGQKSSGIGITPNPRFRGVGKGVRTLDTRNHNPVLSRLSYTHHRSEMVRQEGFEPPAYCLEGSCSIQLSYWRELNGAGDGNRTRIPSLEGWCPSHCATPACALRKNRQLCYNSISVPFCQRFFRIFLRFFMLSE